jgi:hypothetical protein
MPYKRAANLNMLQVGPDEQGAGPRGELPGEALRRQRGLYCHRYVLYGTYRLVPRCTAHPPPSPNSACSFLLQKISGHVLALILTHLERVN